MKKICVLLAACATVMSAGAQQVPNVGFEGTWVDNYPWNSTSNGEVSFLSVNSSEANNDPTYGTQPEGWTVSNVLGMKVWSNWIGSTLVATRCAGKDSESAVKLTNAPNSVATDQIVPAYITLGTTWATSTGATPKNKDGGSFGGLALTTRPDALVFDYITALGSDGTADDKFTALAYTWKGTYTQENVPANNELISATKVTMINRDRHILGMETPQGGTKSQTDDACLIAKGLEYLTGATEGWTTYVLPLSYFTDDAPEMINVVISANDYFSDENIRKDNSITLDNIHLAYYSRLASVSVAGVAIADFNSDVYEYSIDAQVPAAEDVAAIVLGEGKSATTQVSVIDNIVTVTVTNAVGADIDGLSTHTYTFTYNNAAAEPINYTGYLTIEMQDSFLAMNQTATISIVETGENTCTLTLPDFALDLGDGPAVLGDIVVDNVTTTAGEDGAVNYSGYVPELSLLDGEIIAEVTLTGTIKDGKVNMAILVNWSGLDINVTFSTDMYVESTNYDGYLSIEMMESFLAENQPSTISIAETGENTCTITLPDFALDLGEGPAVLGDIVVENVTTTTGEDGAVNYSGYVPELSLLDGEIIAEVTLTGTIKDNKVNMNILVNWNEVDIYVTFSTDQQTTGVGNIAVDTDAAVEYFNIQGVRMQGENLPAGIYIRRQGNVTTKVIVK